MRFSVLVIALSAVAACSANDQDRTPGQTSFTSAPPAGTSQGGGADQGAGGGGGAGSGSNGTTPPTTGTSGGTPRTVEETDLYRLEGNRLYYLNSYRGLMVFDVTNPDQPALIGRSPIFGDPVDMIVRNGIATVVVGDWFGRMDDGTPFHGSIVRGLDATDPANIRVIGEARLGGWVRDDRVVGNVIYAVSEDYGWYYGWGDGSGQNNTPAVIVSSVNFANGIQQVGSVSYPGWDGVFNVTPSSIMLAHGQDNGTSQLMYLDISDPYGHIVQRGSISVAGEVNGWGADNGRWNLDFADGKTAHAIGQNWNTNYGPQGYTISTVDFTNPDAPVLDSALTIPDTGWSVASRFVGTRLYLTPDAGYWNNTSETPFQVYDLSNPAAPRLAGQAQITGAVWNILPASDTRMFALGNSYNTTDSVTLQYLDVTSPSAPTLIGTSQFGNGWAWTPAAGTFKAFTMDATKGLVVLPFSGWDDQTGQYNNGLQLIQFTTSSIQTAGAAHTKGWVERGIFVGNRLVSLSDLSLAVVSYDNPQAPYVVAQLTLARNVVAAQPGGDQIAEVSTDWWGNDVSTSEVRVLPIAQADETADTGAPVATANVQGTNAQVFTNGTLEYVVTDVQQSGACPQYPAQTCQLRSQQVQVVDVSSGTPVLRGVVALPPDQWGWYWWGWEGFWWYDWWGGAEVVQVGSDAIAFRRWEPVYSPNGQYLDDNSRLYVVDLSNPDAPSLASLTIVEDPYAWWGDMRVVGDTLWTTHYEWVSRPQNGQGWVRYYADKIDLTDRAHPTVGAKVNVPGILVGGNANDPNEIYTIDYRWNENDDTVIDDFDVLQVHGHTATLVSQTKIDGWTGSVFVQGTHAYFSAEQYGNTWDTTRADLHDLDLSNPSHPIDRMVSSNGWGWLLDVTGDRALVTSGWGWNGLDIYRLQDGQAPTFEQTVRMRGWWLNSATRQDHTLYLTSGYWGVQPVQLQ
jgi:hypothetical protein